MIKRDVVDMLRESLNTTVKGAETALEAVLDAIVEGCILHGEVSIRGFGTFRVKETGGRQVKIPGTQTLCDVPKRKVLKFRGSRTIHCP